MNSLTKYDEMVLAIRECHQIDEVKDWRDKAKALEAYAQQANNIEAERKAIEIRLRAERKCGELIREQQASGELASQSKHGKGIQSSVAGNDTRKTLADVGISRDQSSKFQKLADIPEDVFEEQLAIPGSVPSTSSLIKSGEKDADKVPTHVVSLWGFVEGFKRKDFYKYDPQDLIEQMPDFMRQQLFDELHTVIDYINQIEEPTWDAKNTA
jgi:hypothetical protein